MTDRLVIAAVPHPSPQVRSAGFDLRSAYVERCWLPIIGPSSVALLRFLPDLWRDQGDVATVDMPALGARLGLSTATGRNAPLPRTLDRLTRFRFARWDDGELHVYVTCPPVTARQLHRLPGAVREEHELHTGVPA